LRKAQPRAKMFTGDKTILKQVLRNECLPALGSQFKYYSTETVKTWLNRRKLLCPSATLNRYFHEFTSTGLVFAAGRGWYSTLATPFTLDHEPVAGLIKELKTTFPLLDFSCWSTEQIRGAMHHLLSRFVIFVHVEADERERLATLARHRVGCFAESARGGGGTLCRSGAHCGGAQRESQKPVKYTGCTN